MQVDLGSSRIVSSVFIINYYLYDETAMRLTGSSIWVGDDSTPWSSSLTRATSEPINEGGFINLYPPIKGRYVVLRRYGPGLNLNNKGYSVSELKVFSVTNLLGYGATILKAP